MVVKRPWREGLRLVPGSVKLMAGRWVLFVIAALPSLAAGVAGFGDGIGDRPYFTEAPDPLPLLPLVRLLDRVPGSVWGTLVLAAGLAWLGNLLLTAGAVAVFGTAGRDRPLVWRTVFEAGTRSLWAYLRIALVALLLAALGTRALTLIAEQLLDHGREAMWTMRALFLVRVFRGVATICWLTLVGVFAWWCRVIVVADQRRRVRRLWTLVPRLWRRRPFGALAWQLLLALAGLTAGGGVLFAWRQSSAGAVGWTLLWLVVLAGLTFLWHWRLRAARLLWSSPELIDLRTVPDGPWGLPEKLAGKFGRRRLAGRFGRRRLAGPTRAGSADG